MPLAFLPSAAFSPPFASQNISPPRVCLGPSNSFQIYEHRIASVWEAPKETAYPSTFIIEQTGRVKFAHVSNSKGDRVSAAKALEVLTAAQ